MRRLAIAVLIPLMSLVWQAGGIDHAKAGEQSIGAAIALAPARAVTEQSRLAPGGGPGKVASGCYTCGLCTTVDCCGGASLGWKLCKYNCGKDASGNQQYACCMVAKCP